MKYQKVICFLGFLLSATIHLAKSVHYPGQPGLNQECKFSAPGDIEGFVKVRCDESKFISCKADGFCRCHYKADPDPNKPNECMKPPPTQNHGEHCGYNYQCLSNFLCDNTGFLDKCRCPRDSPVLKKDQSKCVPGTLGEKCFDFFQYGCHVNASLSCVNGPGDPKELGVQTGKCICPKNKPNWNVQLREGEGACVAFLYGEKCESTEQCDQKRGLTCDNGKCECKTGKKVNWSTIKSECQAGKWNTNCTEENDCATTLMCVENLCLCHHSTKFNASGDECSIKPKHKEHCDENFGCVDTLTCIDEKCECAPDATHSETLMTCVSNERGSHGSKCSNSDQCLASKGLVCQDGICSCPTSSVWNTGSCKDTSKLTSCDPKDLPGVCVDPLSNHWECDSKEKVCDCPTYMEWTEWAQGCKLKAGEKCKDQKGVPIHDICSGQHCFDQTDAAGNEGTCACPPVNGVDQVWSSEPGHGCIKNYIQQPCNVLNGDAECRPIPGTPEAGKYNTDRNGLTCSRDTGSCECRVPYTFSQGYCINASLPYKEKCDRRFGVTCKNVMNTMSCRDSGDGETKCVCLVKVVGIKGKDEQQTILVPMIWDGEQKYCDLKKVGDTCEEAYECKSSLCIKKVCVMKPKRKSTASRIQPLVTSALLVSVSACLSSS